MSVTNFAPDLVQTIVGGGAAGDLTVTGIKPQDKLVAVLNLTDGTDVTAEFTITAVDTINNTGGTTTATDDVFVSYYRADPFGGDLNRS